MRSIEKRLQRLAEALGARRSLCPTCHNAPVNVIMDDDIDGGPPHTEGKRCPTCGSSDALVFRVIYDDEGPTNPTNGWRKDGWDK
jgi:hypothetical protein